MPRNTQGLYSLPAGNPVAPNTLIEVEWANPTMEDIADALTKSLPRDGTAPMTGPLILSGAPTQPTHAASKNYVDQRAASAAGVPVGTVLAFAALTPPATYLMCDGSAVSRTTYAELFGIIGTTFGVGDSSTTFNLPYLGGYFVRGRDVAHPIGTVEASSIKSHTHALNDPTHLHIVTQDSHNHMLTVNDHAHGVNDPGHSHTNPGQSLSAGVVGGTLPVFSTSGSHDTFSASSGVSVQSAGSLGGYTDSKAPGLAAQGAATGCTVAPSPVTGVEDDTWPKNLALNYIIKALP